MKTLLATILAAACFAAAHAAAAQHSAHKAEQKADPKAQTPAADATKTDAVIKRGEAIGDSPAVKFADVLKGPQKYAGRAVVVSGVVERVCKVEGCWMQIAPES